MSVIVSTIKILFSVSSQREC